MTWYSFNIKGRVYASDPDEGLSIVHDHVVESARFHIKRTEVNSIDLRELVSEVER